MRKALITGINGQDGYYLKEFLLKKNYKIIGLSSSLPDQEIENVKIVNGAITNESFVENLIESCQPDEIYNLASQSFPGRSWHMEFETTMINAMGAHIIYKAVKKLNLPIKIFQASSSEMFGYTGDAPINESTPLNPKNPYAVSKCYAHAMGKVYRDSYGLFICNGIMFNHESPLRSMHFITQKVSYAAACLKLGMINSKEKNEKGDPIVKDGKLALGNLNAKRDWGFAGDYVKAMWLMLQQSKPDDYVIGTGIQNSIKSLCEIVFSHVGLDWTQYVTTDKELLRPNETDVVVADPSKAMNFLGWKARTTFEDLMTMMVDMQLSNFK